MSFVVQSARALKVEVPRNRECTCIHRPFRPDPKRGFYAQSKFGQRQEADWLNK